jgi:hypothetical protein
VHPLPQLSRISIFPEGEEFLIMLYGFALPAYLFIDFAEHVKAWGVDISTSNSPDWKRKVLLILFFSLLYISRLEIG